MFRVACIAAVVVTSPVAAGGSAAAGLTRLTSGAPAELCLPADTEGLAEYALGKRRAVFALYQLKPQGAAGTISAVADSGESAVIGLFPGGAFAAPSPAEARRYFLPGTPQSRCWTLSLDGGGLAMVALELSDRLE